LAYGKKLKKVGDVEPYLSYGKLHRTGKLLRGLNSKVSASAAVGRNVVLQNRVKYAPDHELGITSGVAKIKAPYTRGGANTVITGGRIVARPSMNPSRKVLHMPRLSVHKKMRSFGWVDRTL